MPRLLLLSGASTQWKTSALDYLVERAGFVTVPKYGTRPVRPSDTAMFRHIDYERLPETCDICYFYGGNLYGISTDDIRALLAAKDVALVVRSYDAIVNLKRRFGTAVAI